VTFTADQEQELAEQVLRTVKIFAVTRKELRHFSYYFV